MIRLRVDWHAQCPGCGTQLAVDFLEDRSDRTICPWCGCVCNIDCGPNREDVRSYLRKAVQEVEEKANAKTPA